MPIPSISELELAASKIVWNARKKGNLKEYTPRLIRTTLEDQFHLDQGALDAAEYKSAIKAATKAALREDPPPGVGEKSSRVKKQEPSVLKKRKSDGTMNDEKPKSATESPKGKGKAKTVKRMKDEEEDEGGPKKRRKTVPQKKKAVSDDDDADNASSSRPKQRQAQKEKQFKSLEHVPTSDMEEDEPEPQPSLNEAKPKDSASSSKVTSNGPAPPKKDTTPKPSKGKEAVRVPQSGDLHVDDSGAKSESELSELIDEPPKQRRRSKSKSEGKEAKKSRVKKEAPALSKEEERIKRLKSFIVACGVRKVWSRLFQGLDTTQQQIKKLEEILSELGMRGRMTMEQAKAIKKKRELAKELEDVQEFAKAAKAKDSKSRSRGDKSLRETSGSEDEKEDSNDDDEESDVAPKQSINARKSISTFLQDQSSDDE